MPIIAQSNGNAPRELVPAGNHIGRCFQMIQIGTVEEEILGTKKELHKVRIGWELPGEMRVFDEEKGEQPMMISKEYTLSMHEKATLRKDLESWRGKGFTEDEARGFDITRLISVPCMINVIHVQSKSGNEYAKISSISPMIKGMECPPQINDRFELSFSAWSNDKFESLPDFIKDKIKLSKEYKDMTNQGISDLSNSSDEGPDDLPF